MATGPMRSINNTDITPRRPATGSGPVQPPAQQPSKAKARNRWPLIVGAILLLTVAAVVGLRYLHPGVGSLITTDRYQAVKLENGQVYFGKLADVNDEYMKMTDVYYFQTKGDASTKSTDTVAATTDSPTLVKHGTEIQNPEDVIVLSKRDIVSWENLKDSGKVVDAIKNYKAQQGQ